MKKRISILVIVIVLLVSMLVVALISCAKPITVTFDSNGGSKIEAVKGSVESEPVPTKDGFVFKGWFTSKEFSGERVEFPYAPDSDTTVYAKWTNAAEEERLAAIDEVANAIIKSINFDASQKFGATIGLGFGKIGFTANMLLDPTDATAARIGLDIAYDNTKAISIFIDDEFAYAVNDTAKKRFKNIGFAEILDGAEWPAEGISSDYINMLGAILHLLFDTGVMTSSGNTYTFAGGEDAISLVTNLLGDMLPGELVDLLDGMSFKLQATIENGEFVNGAFDIIKSGITLGAGFTDLKAGNDYAPSIPIPAKDDASFDETNILNFTLKGSVSLIDKQLDYKQNELVKFNYELRVDYNIVQAVMNAIKHGGFDAGQLFTTDDAKIYLDVFHKCTDGCTAFCEGKISKSRGSFITLAYSPEDFNSNNLNIAINPKYLLPDGFLESIIDLGGLNILDMFGEYIALNIDPEALLTKSNTNIAQTASQSRISTETNIIKLVNDIISFAEQITLSEDNGLRLGVNQLLELLDIKIADGMNLASLMYPFLGGSSYMDIKVDEAVYGDPTTINNFNVYENFMYVDKSIGDYKNFTSEKGNDFTAAKSIEWLKGIDGNVVMSVGNDIATHDEIGNPISIAESEVRAIAENGYVNYNYIKLNGETGNSSTKILNIYGLDYSIKGIAQNVTVITEMADAGALAGLLGVVSQLMPDFKLSFPGAVFHTSITITDTEKIEFFQSEDAKNKLDESKEYKYGDLVNPEFNITITYKDGTVKEKKVLPENIGMYFSNYSNPDNAALTLFNDYTLVYLAFGEKFTRKINMTDQLVEKGIIEKEFLIGDSLTFNSNIQVEYKLLDGTENTKKAYVRSNADIMAVRAEKGVNVESYYTQSIFGQMWSGYKAVFNNPGVYNFEVEYNPAFIQKYKITVKDKIVIPGYSANIVIETESINVKVNRTEQTGKGLHTDVKVEIPVKGVMTVLSTEDYELQDMNGNLIVDLFIDDFLINAYEFKIVIKNSNITLTGTAKITLLAKDLGNAIICIAEAKSVNS